MIKNKIRPSVRPPSAAAVALLASVLFLCLPAHSNVGAGHAAITTVRGCLRRLDKSTFILVGDDGRGYTLTGNVKVFRRHTDQQVEVTGTASPQAPLSAHSVMATHTAQPSHRAKAHQLSDLPGLANVQVSSLMPLAKSCTEIPSPGR